MCVGDGGKGACGGGGGNVGGGGCENEGVGGIGGHRCMCRGLSVEFE